jgi:intraflagellar transport protein 172
MDSAINHFIEAGKFERAVEAAMESKQVWLPNLDSESLINSPFQWAKAVQIVDNLDPEVGKKFYKRIARQYEDSLNFEFAERYYVKVSEIKAYIFFSVHIASYLVYLFIHFKGGYSQDAVDMYTKVNMWEAAHTIAVT